MCLKAIFNTPKLYFFSDKNFFELTDVHMYRILQPLFSQSVSLTQYVVLFVRPSACLPVPVSLLSIRPSSFCLIHFVGTSGAEEDLRWKTTFDGRGPLMEDDLWWKTTFDWRPPLTEDDIWRKATFDGRWPLTKDDLWRKMIFDGRGPLTEDDLWWKTTFYGRQSFMEDILWWKTNFDERRPWMEDKLWWKMTFDGRRPLMEDDLPCRDLKILLCHILPLR